MERINQEALDRVKDKDFLDINEATAIFECSRSTIHRLCQKGLVHAYKVPMGGGKKLKWAISKKGLLDYYHARKEGAERRGLQMRVWPKDVPKNWLTMREAVEVTGWGKDAIGRWCRDGLAEAERRSNCWFLEPSQLSNFTKKPPDGWLTTAQARRVTGLTRARLSKLALEGKVEAQKAAGRWHFEEESLQRHMRRREKYMPKDYKAGVPR
jgi:predicted DNA-binding transcriptional regulator AlpA